MPRNLNKKDSFVLSEKWKKAAMIGGLWAGIEIVIGSFLHNMRIPFAGTILAAQGIVVLLAFTSFWNEKGIIIRAGIITALMKSISPSAVILGPMTGILTEALLLEFFLFLFGRNLAAYMIASAMALASAFIHKIVTFLILYSFDIVAIYENIYQWFQRTTGFNQLDATEFLLSIIVVYIIGGSIIGIIGYKLGKEVKKLDFSEDLDHSDPSNVDLFPLNKSQKFHFSLLFLHMISIPIGLFLLNVIYYWLGISFILIYIISVIFYYKNSMRRLKKPLFWFQLIIIIVLATVFVQGDTGSFSYINFEGFINGLSLSFRALFVVISFTAISVELRNPKITKYLNNIFVKSIYEALSISFSVLPKIIQLLPPIKTFVLNPINTFSKLIAITKNDYEINLKD